MLLVMYRGWAARRGCEVTTIEDIKAGGSRHGCLRLSGEVHTSSNLPLPVGLSLRRFSSSHFVNSMHMDGVAPRVVCIASCGSRRFQTKTSDTHRLHPLPFHPFQQIPNAGQVPCTFGKLVAIFNTKSASWSMLWPSLK
jgi:hypothetical protein